VAGEVFQGAWDLYQRFWRHFIPIALIVFVVIAAVTLLMTLAFGDAGMAIAGVLSFVGLLFLQGALAIAVQDVRDGRVDLSIGETLRRVTPHLGSLILAAFLVGIGFVVAVIVAVVVFPPLLILVFIAFLFLLTRWAVLVPAIVLEGKSAIDAFRRSQELVRGQAWPVFAVILLSFLVQIVASLVVSLVFVWLQEDARAFVQSLVTNTLVTPFIAAAWTLMYFRLRGPAEAATPPEPTFSAPTPGT
jgi:hypothetical protein